MSNSFSKYRTNLLSLIFSLCTAFAMLGGKYIDFHIGAVSLFDGIGWLWYVLLSICLYLFYGFLYKKKIVREKLRLCVLVSVFLSGWYLIGKICYYSYSVYDVGNYIQYAVVFAGMLVFYIFLTKAVFVFLNTADFNGRAITAVYGRFTGHIFRNSFITIFVFWLPHLIVKYPSGMCGDAAGQISECFYEYMTHHPLAHTLLMGSFVKLGIKLGSANVGIFLFTAGEMIVDALICSYTVSAMDRLGCRKWTVIAALAFFCMNAYVQFSAGECQKDNYYAFFSLLFIVMLTEYVSSGEAFSADKRKLLLFLVSCSGVWLFRNNGKYLVLPVILVLLILEVKKRAEKKVGNSVLFFICLICCVLLPFTVNKTLAVVTDAQKGSIAEALSLPFQQTARFVKYHSDELSEEEKQTIDKVLTYGELAEKYRSDISDPVKSGYRQWAGKRELTDYFILCGKMFLRQPLCGIGSVAEQSYYLFFPDHSNYSFSINTVPCMAYKHLYSITTPDILTGIQERYNSYINFMCTAPLIGLINNMAVYIILFLIIAVCALNMKDYKFFVVLLPLLITVLIVFAAPCIKNHPRYVFPCIYSFPVIVGFYTARRNNEGQTGEKEQKDEHTV